MTKAVKERIGDKFKLEEVEHFVDQLYMIENAFSERKRKAQ